MIETGDALDPRPGRPERPSHRGDFLVLLVTSVVTKATGFLVLAVSYRFLERETLGLYFFGMSLASVLVLITGLNLMPALVREISAGTRPFSVLMSAGLALKGLLGLLYLVICVLAFRAVGYGADGGKLLLIALIVLLEDADATLANVLIAKNRVRYHVLSTAVAYAVLVAAFALYYRLLGPSLWVLILAQVTKTVVLVGLSLGLLHFRIERLRPTVSGREVASLARASLPFLLIALAAVSYRHILNFWLSGLGRLDLAADFGLALFVVNGLMFFTYINNSLLYPRVCREPAGGHRIVLAGLVFNLVGGGAIAGLVTALCAVLPGIPALEKYAAVLDLLAVLIWVLPGMYLTAFLSMILYGFRRERMVLAVGFGGIVVFTALSGIGLELVGESALFWAFFLTYAGQTVGLGAAYLGLRHGKDRAARGTEIVVEPS